MNGDLFAGLEEAVRGQERLGAGAVLLRGFAAAEGAALLAAVDGIAGQAPFRHMLTPGGFSMSVAMCNCGPLGWVSDEKGYRYQAQDPLSGLPWPPMPAPWRHLAREAAAAAGFPDFVPDACLINRYVPGSKMSLHQDRDERDLGQPIVSVSLGLPAMFLFGGLKRADAALRRPLFHGDVVVWGGPDRLRYHGVLALKDGHHPLAGIRRINLTFRKAA